MVMVTLTSAVMVTIMNTCAGSGVLDLYNHRYSNRLAAKGCGMSVVMLDLGTEAIWLEFEKRSMFGLK